MTKEEFQKIIKPIWLLDDQRREFIKAALEANFDKYIESEVENLPISDTEGQNEEFICHSCNTKRSGKNDDQLHEVCKECFNSI